MYAADPYARRRVVDPYYSGGAYSASQNFGPYTRGALVPDVQMRVPLYSLEDIARIKDALAIEGVYNVICDIPDQTVVVSTRLRPQTIVNIVRRVMGDAVLLNVVDPYLGSPALMPPPIDRSRYSSYDDMYSYPTSAAYTYDPYGGRSYDNEFRPSRYYTGSSYY
jgi:hypothetical protein